jgi:hypothetical protein
MELIIKQGGYKEVTRENRLCRITIWKIKRFKKEVVLDKACQSFHNFFREKADRPMQSACL